jgi:preprotein translocase subunit SecA
MEAQRRAIQELQFKHAEAAALAQQAAAQPSALRPSSAEREEAVEATQHTPFVRGERKVGRNEPCPCGSGKKFKQCHGRLS